MSQSFDEFRRTYMESRRPMIGDPMVGDNSTRHPPYCGCGKCKAARGAAGGQGVPTPTPLPHQQTPSGPPPTPDTRPAPMGPGNTHPWQPRR